MSPSKTHYHIIFKDNWTLGTDDVFMLGQCEAIIRTISEIPLPPKERQRLLLVSLRKGAQATTAIEGNTLTEEEIARIDEGESLPPSREYLEIEVKNIIEALNAIREDVILNDRSSVITPELIQNFHRFVGKNLGDHFQAIPGQFRQNNVVVGTYRPPEYTEINALVQRLCEWMRDTFRYEEGSAVFIKQVVHAIVFHVYIAWIHPFGDGNGRTARLVEFHLLLRAGLPDIASHILSNFYNNTREEYYRQLSLASREGDLTRFIHYAVQGFRDGLAEALSVFQNSVLQTAWKNYIYDALDSKKAQGKSKAIVKRRRNIALHFPVDRFYGTDELFDREPVFIKEYSGLSNVTRARDFQELERLELIARDGNKYKGNIQILKGMLPQRRRR